MTVGAGSGGVAFESFRSREQRPSRRQRQLSFALSVVFHGALIAAGVAFSFWHVEELSPPKLRVTFMSMPPPPPPPPPPPLPQLAAGSEDIKRVAPPAPPPAGGHAGAKKAAIETPLPAREEPRKDEDEYDDEDPVRPSVIATTYKDSIGEADSGEGPGVRGGAKDGTSGGAPGGKVGGAPAAPGPQSLSPQVGTLQKESGDMPPFPSSLMHDKLVYRVETKICVSTNGAVYRLTIRKRSGTILDANVVDTVKKWRYRPLTVNNEPVPFCYPVTFEFRSES
jgi:TonB family protein